MILSFHRSMLIAVVVSGAVDYNSKDDDQCDPNHANNNAGYHKVSGII